MKSGDVWDRRIQVVLLLMAIPLRWNQCWSLSGVVVVAAESSSSSSTLSSPSYYESVRSLDSYGNAVQLQYAQAAADQQGRLIVAVMLPHGRRHNNHDHDDNDEMFETTATWVISPVTRPPPHHRPDSSRSSSNSRRLLQAVTSPEPVTVLLREPLSDAAAEALTKTTAVYLVCTGVQADAAWLLRQLRRYGANVAERYGSHQPHSVSNVAALLKRRFWGYSSSGGGNDDDNDNDDSRAWLAPGYESMQQSPHGMRSFGMLMRQESSPPAWGRPLGIRTILISLSKNQKPLLELVEPSGIITTIQPNDSVAADLSLVCMGKNCDKVQKELLKVKAELTEAVDDGEVDDLLLSAFSAALSTTVDEPPLSLQLEILHSGTGNIVRRTIVRGAVPTETFGS